MSQTYEPGTDVVLTMTDQPVPAVVVTDDGGDTVVVRYAHPRLELETTAVPVLRAFLAPGAPPA